LLKSGETFAEIRKRATKNGNPSRHTTNQQNTDISHEDSVDVPDKHHASDTSIFDSCCDYIITGNELTGTVINLSAHEMHVLTRPTIIHDEKYERNSLLFSVGFVLRRSSDPRPFQPIISKWAQSLREMELESQFLSNPSTRSEIQPLLEQLLISLNSQRQECILHISSSCVLHLKPFHPPRPPSLPVPDHAVPVLLLRSWRQFRSYYDWDLAIDWCGRHIDGVRNARQISEVAEVDMEIVRACLRVLKHHGVIALCDMFFYSNRYEATERAMSLLAGNEPQLLSAAVEHSIQLGESLPSPDSSPLLHAMPHSPDSLASSTRTTDRDRIALSSRTTFTLPHTPTSDVYWSAFMSKREDLPALKLAVAEFYSRCERTKTFGDTWMSLVNGTTSSNDIDWKRTFRVLDHRRLALFGVVHGLIKRIHRFPRLLNSNIQSTGTPNQPEYRSPETPPTAERGTLPRQVPRQLISSGSTKKRTTTLDVGAIRAKMDGRHCDDELACEFQKSLDELLELVGGRGNVSTTFAPKVL